MNDIIGRRRGGRGHRRRFQGGYPSPSPYPYPYPYPGAQDAPGPDADADADIGSDPFGGGVAYRMELGPDLRLYVSVVVDGVRHDASVDLSDVVRDVVSGVSCGPSQDVADRIAGAVGSAGALVVGALCDRHARHASTISAGWWSSIKGVVHTVSIPTAWINKKVAQTIQKVPGLKKAVTIAATAVATAYGGPAAGMAASNLVGPIIDNTARTGGDPTKIFSSAKDDARKMTKDPKVVKAIDHAQHAITQTATAYALKSMADKANAGDAQSARGLAGIRNAAHGGDPAAARAMQILDEIQIASSDPGASANQGAAPGVDPYANPYADPYVDPAS